MVGLAARTRIAALAVLIGVPVAACDPTVGRVSGQGNSPSSTNAFFPTRCTPEPLPVPAGDAVSKIFSGDSSGRYVVGSTATGPGAKEDHSVLWHDGRPQVVDIPLHGHLYDVNASGTAVGFGPVAGSTDRFQGWVYRAGEVTAVHGSGSVLVAAINNVGEMVGQIDGRPARWAFPDAEPTLLALPEGADWVGAATDIDDDGTILYGAHAVPDGLAHSYILEPSGQVSELKPLIGPVATRNDAHASQVRGDWVIGVSGQFGVSGSEHHVVPTIWNLATGRPDRLDWDVAATTPSGILLGLAGLDIVLTDGVHRLVLTEPADVGHYDGSTKSAPSLGTISDDARVVTGSLAVSDDAAVAVVWHCE